MNFCVKCGQGRKWNFRNNKIKNDGKGQKMEDAYILNTRKMIV